MIFLNWFSTRFWMTPRLFWVDLEADFKPSIFKQDKWVWFSGVEMPENAVRQSLSAFQIVILLRMIPNSYAVKAIFRRKSRLLRIHLSVAVWWLKIQLKKTVLFNTQCGRNSEKRLTQPAPHLRNKACNWCASWGGTVKALTPRQVADLLGHTTSEITEMYYVKRNTDMLMGVTNGFELWLMRFWWYTKRITWTMWHKVNKKRCENENSAYGKDRAP